MFDFSLRNELCDTVDGVKNKEEWPVKDGQFATLITAINNANLDYPGIKDLPQIKIKQIEAIRKAAKGSWFRNGGRTRKLRRRKTRKGKLRRRKTMQRKLRKR